MVNSTGHGDSDPHASGGDALKCRLRSLASRADEAREFDWVAEVPGRECGKKHPDAAARGRTWRDVSSSWISTDGKRKR
jgi:hypothetical protein